MPIRTPATTSASPIARAQLERRPVQRQAVVLDGHAQRLTQLAGPGTQIPHLGHAAPSSHCSNSGRRLDRPDQHRARRAGLLAHEVQAPVDAVGPVDVSVAGRPEHHRVALGLPAEAVRRRVGVVIGLDLDDPAADTVNQQRRPDQVGRHLMDGAVKEASLEPGQRRAFRVGLWLCRASNSRRTFRFYGLMILVAPRFGHTLRRNRRPPQICCRALISPP